MLTEWRAYLAFNADNRSAVFTALGRLVVDAELDARAVLPRNGLHRVTSACADNADLVTRKHKTSYAAEEGEPLTPVDKGNVGSEVTAANRGAVAVKRKPKAPTDSTGSNLASSKLIAANQDSTLTHHVAQRPFAPDKRIAGRRDCEA